MTGLRRCRACGALLAESDVFCGECGSDIKPQAPPRKKETPASREERRDVARLVRAANLQRMRGRQEAALRLCRQAAELDPHSVMARSLLSELLLEQEDLVGAVEEMAVTTELAKRTEASRGALELARRSRAEIEASIVEKVLGREEQQPWNLDRLFLDPDKARGASRDFNRALAAAGLIGHLLALAAATALDPLGFVWFGLTGICAYWTRRHARRRVGSARFWTRLVLAAGPPGFIIYLLNHD